MAMVSCECGKIVGSAVLCSSLFLFLAALAVGFVFPSLFKACIFCSMPLSLGCIVFGVAIADYYANRDICS